MREWLLDAIRYDLWANRRWAPLVMGTLEEVALPEPPDDVPTEPVARAADTFAHILHGQRLWLARCGVEVASEGEGWIDALHEAWVAQIERREPDEIVAFTRHDGSTIALPFSDIVWNIVNHGTYHRGGLREIVEPALALFPGDDFPETDLTHWRAEIARR